MLSGGQPGSRRPSGLLARGQNSFCQSPSTLLSPSLASAACLASGRRSRAGLSCCHFLVQWPRPPPRRWPRFCTCGRHFLFFALFFSVGVFLKAGCIVRKATLGNIREIKQLDTPVFGNQTVGIRGDSAAAKRVPASAPEKSRVIRRRLREKKVRQQKN